MPDALTPESLSQRIIDAGLIDARDMESLWAELGTREVHLHDLVSLLLRKELLTNFQLDRLNKGERGGYFYGDYKVLYLVGTGTFARVYRAVNMKNGKVYAVKALRKRFREDKSITEQFVREGEIGVTLRHPNIVPIFDVSAKPVPFLTMEFVEGRNLREFIQIRKRLEPAAAMRLGVDILAGLAHAAEKGHTHRDLKMSNVLITSRGQAKLVDFGLAGLHQMPTLKDSQETTNPRTIDYAALERASGVRNNDPRSDLFFAGSILYNMLAGVSPIGESKARIDRLSSARFQNIKPLNEHAPGIPSRLVAFVMRALELNPEKRYATAKEMYDDAKRLLARIEAGESIDADAPDAAPGRVAKSELKLHAEQEGTNRTVMVVESKMEMQDLLRDRLKKHGYRVLVFSDPERAINRFQEFEAKPADCVIFCAQNLEGAALDAFNTFGARVITKDIPAILFVDNKQTALIKAAQLADHRLLLSMPVKVRELRDALVKLLGPPAEE